MSYVSPLVLCDSRPRYDDRVSGGGVVVADVGAVEEGSSDEEEEEVEPIYDQPDEGDDEFNE